MKLGRVQVDGRAWLARLEVGEVVLLQAETSHPAADVLREAFAAGLRLDGQGARRSMESVRLLAPVASPSKILAIGLNYADHVRESAMETPSSPVVFTKACTSVIGPRDSIHFRHDLTTQVDYEAELAVIVGRRCRNVPVRDAAECVLGYTVLNDVSARDLQFRDGQWDRGKSLDTFAPIGPWIVTRDAIQEVQSLSVRAWINGHLLQDGNTPDMIYSVTEIVSYLSESMTLLPGDVIATGTPYGVGFARTPPVFLKDGDEVVVEIEDIGRLQNSVSVDPDLVGVGSNVDSAPKREER